MSLRRLLLIPAMTAALLSCGREHSPARTGGPAVKVQTLEVQLQRAPEIYEAVGTVRPRLSAVVSPKVMAAIQQIPVKPGDVVRAGDPLARLDDRDLRAEFDRAKADFDRFESLLEKQVVTRAEFDAVQSRYRVAAAALSYATIAAPFDGIVAQKLCDVGDLASPGKPLFVVDQPTDYRLEAEVPERFASVVGLGKSVHVVVEATGEKCVGAVGEIVPASDPASRSFLIKIDLQCRQGLRSGIFGRAQLAVGERPAMFVPSTTVRERGQLTFVYVAADGRAQMRLVKTGKSYLDATEILAGLQPGERVIIAGEVADGQPVSE
jgi:RND family efflux transporter MFP subunit